MSTAIAIHWTEPALQFVVAQAGTIVAAASVAVEAGLDPTTVGQRLGTALAPFSPGRAKVVVALSRGTLDWQHLSLPPCPAEELPDVVRLQADRDLNAPNEDLGFDFLQLEGDAQTPCQVLTVALAADKLAQIRQACRAANLTLERIVPLATGWPALTKQASLSPKSGLPQQGTHLLVGPLGFPAPANPATLWATRGDRVVLFRQFQLSTADDPATSAARLAGELRRTLITLSQHASSAAATISLVGDQQDQLTKLASTLAPQLDVTPQTLDVAAQHPQLRAGATTATSALPLAGLAIDELQGRQPLVDLLHPRGRPQERSHIRTYCLAAVAGASLFALFGWLSYARLQAPLQQAAEDEAELTLLEQPLDKLKEYEKRAAAIRAWSAGAPNLLIHLQQVSLCLRPARLDAEGFEVDQDVVLEQLGLEKRLLTIDALARSSRAVQPLEARLRESGYRPQRGKSDPSQSSQDYPWHFQSTIEITSASDRAGQFAGDAAAPEPAS